MFFLILMYLFIGKTFALDWWEVPRQETLTDFTYVGVSEGSNSIDELKDKAFISAATLIVREHFGTKVEASESVIEDTGNSKYQFITKLQSESMILKGLKLIDFKIIESQIGSRVFVRVQISKEDLKNAISTQNQDQVENIYGRGKGENYVFIKTIPHGAQIQFTGIDHKYVSQGQGDAKFYLPKGRYNLEIYEPGHKVIQSEVTVLQENQDFEYKLEPILGELELKTTPFDAEIIPLSAVNGNNPFKLMPHRKYRFRVYHPDYFEQEIEYSITDEGHHEKYVYLDPRPSTIRFFISNKNHSLIVNGRSYSTGERITVYGEKAEVMIKSPGFKTYKQSINLRPNRDYPDERITLEKEVVSNPIKFEFNNPFADKYQERFVKRLEYNPAVQINEEAYFSIVPLSYYLEWTYIGLGASVYYISLYKDNGEKTVNTTILDHSFNLRLFSPRFDSAQFYLNLTSGAFTLKEEIDDFENPATYERKFNYHGVGLGIRFYTSKSFSYHIELNQIHKKLDEDSSLESMKKYKNNELKGVLGIGWEF